MELVLGAVQLIIIINKLNTYIVPYTYDYHLMCFKTTEIK